MRPDGCWSVTTETGSMYMLDLDHGVVVRLPDKDNPEHSDMRRDGDNLALYGLLEEPTVGRPLMLLLDVTGDPGNPTVRMTSYIVEIKELDRVNDIL